MPLVLESIQLTNVDESEVDDLLNLVDVDHSGEIELDEFKVFMIMLSELKNKDLHGPYAVDAMIWENPKGLLVSDLQLELMMLQRLNQVELVERIEAFKEMKE